MDNNDFRPSGPDDSNNNINNGTPENPQAFRGDNNGAENPQAFKGDNQGYGFSPGGFSNNGNYGNMDNGGGPQGPYKQPKKRGKGRKALIAVLMALCLIAGCAVGVFVIGNDFLANKGSDLALATPGESGLKPLSTPAPDSTPDSSLTTDDPSIGGQAPSIDYSQSPIIQIAKQVGPSVVGVAVSARQTGIGQGETTEQEYGYGTGIIVSADGYILTNNHVTTGSDSIKVTLYDGKEYPASLVGADITTDLAVIKIEATGLTPAAIGNSDDLQVGETVVAIGNPLGSELAGSVTSGIVSALNREITTNSYSQKYIQTDAAINPGNSGGPLVNLKGEVIGVNTLKTYLAGYDDYGMPIGTEGIGFAIPMTTAEPVMEQLITKGSVERPGIGITCLVDETNQYNPSGSPAGVTVVKVIQGGPADVAGIEPSDIITSLDGTAVKTVEELKGILQAHKVGDVLDITVWRSGQEYKAKITVGDQNNMG